MLAQTSYVESSPVRVALAHRRAIKVLARLPVRPIHASLLAISRIEAWLRWPVRTMSASERMGQTLTRIDPAGSRFGLTHQVKLRHVRNTLYDALPDLLVLLTRLDQQRFVREAVIVEDGEALRANDGAGRGVIVAGFRFGPHSAIPYLLAALGHDVSMIVSTKGLAESASRLGREFAPRASRRLRFLSAEDPMVLTKTLGDLGEGRVVCTLMELSPGEFKKTPVRFLDWTASVPYGVPYLAAATGSAIVPAVLTRRRGPKFRLSFLEPLPPPSRAREPIFATTQALYDELGRQVRRFPAQWAGWTLLESEMGINLDQRVPAGGGPS